jgi:hypothetical protein
MILIELIALIAANSPSAIAQPDSVLPISRFIGDLNISQY